MKPAMRTIVALLTAASGMALAVNNVQAGDLTMTERENVQIRSWSVEFLAIFIALAIAVFVWRLSKRDRKKRNEKHQDITTD
jgi:hypothetical protein